VPDLEDWPHPDPSTRDRPLVRSLAEGAITQLLHNHRNGDENAFGKLVPLVYEDLRQIARLQLRRLRPGQALQTTGLVHGAYLRLVDQREADWKHRGHFFAVVSTAMRQILIDHARYLSRDKRGGGAEVPPLDEQLVGLSGPAQELLDLDLALDKLAAVEARQVRVVECRYFAGLTVEETAAALEIGKRTVEREWLKAKSWLRRELSGGLPDSEEGEKE
jgi:RNA polymerase sigma factor (TIGR02999 family)